MIPFAILMIWGREKVDTQPPTRITHSTIVPCCQGCISQLAFEPAICVPMPCSSAVMLSAAASSTRTPGNQAQKAAKKPHSGPRARCVQT